MRLVVAARRMLTADVCELVLRNPDGSPLPAAEPGAHLTVATPSGAKRSYSLTGDLRDRSRYTIAVRRSEGGRGGSRSLVDSVAVGDALEVDGARNSFELVEAPAYLLIAAGIGVTPIRAMLTELGHRGATDVELLYLTRSREESPYLDELTAALPELRVHHRRERGPVDWWSLLAEPGERHLYVCGPEALQEEIRALTMHWRPSRVHAEDFAGVPAFDGLTAPFTVEWRPTGVEVAVPAARTMLDALEDAGIDVPSSCVSGTCGTCRLRLVEGAVDHRDLVLTAEERESAVMPCVSRGVGRVAVAPR
ncbi:PDR/VanB family oxidoreductase [Rathayibacter sp. ZW T2_19]|uniref:PDR/VanB family oxidoreductase n=1 Tax=Rathayibacter rubneri TaxID=2950106 RepID=A0A9X2IU21_9MICO|nr:PDR/VanB family oxidoreductase [Rathayibacter rubneri]MCM6762224.1 PDR/VanB family oxidoreductase [Rathayibacter rubneri]